MDDFNKGLQKAAEQYGIFTSKPEPPKVKFKAEEEEGPLFDYQMKRFFACVGFLAFCLCCFKAADHGALDGAMKVAVWGILLVFGGGFVHGALLKD
jgi:hypothetical protein